MKERYQPPRDKDGLRKLSGYMLLKAILLLNSRTEVEEEGFSGGGIKSAAPSWYGAFRMQCSRGESETGHSSCSSVGGHGMRTEMMHKIWTVKALSAYIRGLTLLKKDGEDIKAII